MGLTVDRWIRSGWHAMSDHPGTYMYTVQVLVISRRLSRQLSVHHAGNIGYPPTAASLLDPLRELREEVDSETLLVARSRRL